MHQKLHIHDNNTVLNCDNNVYWKCSSVIYIVVIDDLCSNINQLKQIFISQNICSIIIRKLNKGVEYDRLIFHVLSALHFS